VKGTVSLSTLYKEYNNKIQFLLIYIREAHPKDGWWLGEGLIATWLAKRNSPYVSLNTYDPKTFKERQGVATICQSALKYGIPTYVDDVDDAVSKAYAAWPTRLYLVGLDGRVVYAGGPGPQGFSPEEFKKAIDTYLEAKAGI
jgi:hypothetical protein